MTPLNSHARKWVQQQTRMTEEEWATVLYHVRGTEVPAGLFAGKEVEI
jgi:hypothetical protein